ncbi:MAG: Gfo/Idh/MocA family oxidoreductase [Verrucomicrobiota bacterium]
MSDPLFKIGVLGATGFIGTPYREEIRSCPNARIVALNARRPDLLAQAAETDQAELTTHDWREVVEHPEVNLIIVATPDALHHEAVMACAEAGKHLLCEKPIGMNVGEAEDMWQAYHRLPDLGHYVPFWTRYVEVFARAREIVAAGELGEIMATIYRWQNPRPAGMPLTWRDDPALSSAGTIADVGSHAYDVVRWITGQAAESVLAHGDTLTPIKADLGEVNLGEALDWGKSHEVSETEGRKGGTVDYANVSCRFDGGANGVFLLSHTTFLRKHLAPELELHGTRASLSIDRWSGQVVLVNDEQEKEVLDHLPDQGFGNRFEKHVFPALVPFVQGEVPAEPEAHPNLKDGWIAQRFTDAASRSVKEGHWVDV